MLDGARRSGGSYWEVVSVSVGDGLKCLITEGGPGIDERKRVRREGDQIGLRWTPVRRGAIESSRCNSIAVFGVEVKPVLLRR